MKNFLPVLVIVLVSACSPKLVPYTAKVQNEIGLNVEDLKKVQFYNSDRIILVRKLDQNSTKVNSGKIKVINGETYEQVVIHPNTPGVLVQGNDGKRLGISFEEGPNRYLLFGLDPRKSGVFSIYGRDWQNQVATIDYDGHEFRLAKQSSDVILMVNYKKLNDLKVNVRTARGRSVD